MLLDVPTSDELTQAGTNLLNLAWATDQPYRQITSSMRIGRQPRLAGRRLSWLVRQGEREQSRGC
jgi:hypothetical protein